MALRKRRERSRDQEGARRYYAKLAAQTAQADDSRSELGHVREYRKVADADRPAETSVRAAKELSTPGHRPQDRRPIALAGRALQVADHPEAAFCKCMKLRALAFGLLCAAFSTGTTLAQDWAKERLKSRRAITNGSI